MTIAQSSLPASRKENFNPLFKVTSHRLFRNSTLVDAPKASRFVQQERTPKPTSTDRPWNWVSLTGNLATECEYEKACGRKFTTVGMFDSGVGGLTVFAEFRKRFPHINVVYFADMSRQPYGPRTQPQVAGFCHEILSFMRRQGCEMGVIACNTATAACFDFGVNENPTFRDFPVFGTIPFAAMAALAEADLNDPILQEQAPRVRKQMRVGVLATQGTCLSGAYARSLTCRASCKNYAKGTFSFAANESKNKKENTTEINSKNETSDDVGALYTSCGEGSLSISPPSPSLQPFPPVSSPVSVMCACPEFMHIAEAGTVLEPHTRKMAEEYMAPLRSICNGGEGKVDALIYGCTHYPILKQVVEDVLFNSLGYGRTEVKLVDPATVLVDKMGALIAPPPTAPPTAAASAAAPAPASPVPRPVSSSFSLTGSLRGSGSIRFCVNADAAGFAERATRILGQDIRCFCEVVDLQA